MSDLLSTSDRVKATSLPEDRLVRLFQRIRDGLEDDLEVSPRPGKALELRLGKRVGALWAREGDLSLRLMVVPRYEGSVERMLSMVLSGERLMGGLLSQMKGSPEGARPPLAAVAAFLESARALTRRTRSLEGEREDEVRGRVRGRLRTRQYATRRAFTRPWSFPVVLGEKDLDHLANRVLKVALLKSLDFLQNTSSDTAGLVDTRPALLLLSELRGVEAVLPKRRDLLRLRRLLSKRFVVYKRAVELAWGVLFPGEWLPPDDTGRRVFSSERARDRGFDLLDMAVLFERYLGALLEELVKDTPGVRLCEETLRGFFLEERSPSGVYRRIPLRLDVPPLAYGEFLLVLDAKYKSVGREGYAERRWEAYWSGQDLTLKVPEGHVAEIDLGRLRLGLRLEGGASPRGVGKPDLEDLYQVIAYATHREVIRSAGGRRLAVGLVYPSSRTEVLSVVRGLGHRSSREDGVPVFLLGLGLEEEKPRLETWLREILAVCC